MKVKIDKKYYIERYLQYFKSNSNLRAVNGFILSNITIPGYIVNHKGSCIDYDSCAKKIRHPIFFQLGDFTFGKNK
ncbi:hypothetical protein [Saccharicrinis carchari]|nr:hypothetical protein [Saccharicrinis carchari]